MVSESVGSNLAFQLLVKDLDIMICDMCQNYCYDEEFDEYYCDINLDEDEYLRFLSTVTETKCPYFKNGDEYTIVRKQN